MHFPCCRERPNGFDLSSVLSEKLVLRCRSEIFLKRELKRGSTGLEADDGSKQQILDEHQL